MPSLKTPRKPFEMGLLVLKKFTWASRRQTTCEVRIWMTWTRVGHVSSPAWSSRTCAMLLMLATHELSWVPREATRYTLFRETTARMTILRSSGSSKMEARSTRQRPWLRSHLLEEWGLASKTLTCWVLTEYFQDDFQSPEPSATSKPSTLAMEGIQMSWLQSLT